MTVTCVNTLRKVMCSWEQTHPGKCRAVIPANPTTVITKAKEHSTTTTTSTGWTISACRLLRTQVRTVFHLPSPPAGRDVSMYFTRRNESICLKSNYENVSLSQSVLNWLVLPRRIFRMLQSRCFKLLLFRIIVL